MPIKPARKRTTNLAIRTKPIIKAFVEHEAAESGVSIREYVEDALIRNTAFIRFKKQRREDTHAIQDQEETRNDH